MKIKNSNSEKGTEALGYELGLLLKNEPKIVILLDGELGSGKTTFTKGLAKAYGVTQIVNSPTYTIMKKYKTNDYKRTFYHLDLYRLDGVGSDFDLEEYIDGQGMIVVEWPFQVEDLLPRDYLLVKINKTSDYEREFTMTCVGYPCKRAVEYI
ncbi:MAG: tRNA (adenosine(37)-N6)-threonylcarbamoyltransferase complex ATPase subunit type 1 TsaE [Acholeplasmataceae bacterium]|jgi:tRNA threonylcarbamoyladenosine biosynthesis protein TsaE|nr:tRNA (adenosine(37)-N6)-threonylcarbamoyltransferase complex ATPase subunit type 1 TsaE [Acholeplasmataceae bacterium]